LQNKKEHVEPCCMVLCMQQGSKDMCKKTRKTGAIQSSILRGGCLGSRLCGCADRVHLLTVGIRQIPTHKKGLVLSAKIWLEPSSSVEIGDMGSPHWRRGHRFNPYLDGCRREPSTVKTSFIPNSDWNPIRWVTSYIPALAGYLVQRCSEPGACEIPSLESPVTSLLSPCYLLHRCLEPGAWMTTEHMCKALGIKNRKTWT
jgi:hypothetical protein